MENALLHPAPWLTARAIKDYHDPPNFEMDEELREWLEMIVAESLRLKAEEASAKADRMLKDKILAAVLEQRPAVPWTANEKA